MKTVSQPKVVAHRGLSNMFPENTLQAITSALYYADLVEFDVLLTKDNEMIVFHDRNLSEITNVSELDEFKKRKHKDNACDYFQEKDDWWVKDFTLEELKKLRVFQRSKKRPQLKHLQFRIVSLEELLLAVLQTKKELKSNNSGLLIELKSEKFQQFTPRDRILCQKVSALLKKYQLDSPQNCKNQNLPIFVQSFQLPMLKQLTTDNQVYQLYENCVSLTYDLLKREQYEKVKGIGITLEHIQQENFKEICEKFNYDIFFWTLRDDEKELIGSQSKNYNMMYRRLKEAGITGFITEFPNKCRGALEIDFT